MRSILIKLIEFYQKYISFYFNFHGIKCKFYPTCSQYMKEALLKYGTCKGLYLGIKRIIKCNPFSKGGYDPLK